MGDKLRVNEIFGSMSGEVNMFGQGALTTFIRLQGCNLRCNWCDTKYAQKVTDGKEMNLDQIIRQVKKLKNPFVTLTGGEPLAQILTSILLMELDDKGYSTILETNGSYDWTRPWYPADCYMVDYKLGNSAMSSRMLPYKTFAQLRPEDGIKFVVTDRHDFDQAREVLRGIKRFGGERFAIVFSCAGDLEPKRLFTWMETDLKGEDYRSRARLNIQLHKIIGVR